MNRRNLFGAFGALIGVAALRPTPRVRQVMFNPPKQAPAIFWMNGHVTGWRMDAFCNGFGTHPDIDPSQVKHGYGTRKLSLNSMYLSDVPLPNYEPITYWIPADWEKEIAA